MTALPPDRFRVLLYCNPDPDNMRAWAWRVAWREGGAWHTADEHGLCIPHVIGAGDWRALPPPPATAYGEHALTDGGHDEA